MLWVMATHKMTCSVGGAAGPPHFSSPLLPSPQQFPLAPPVAFAIIYALN